MADTDLPEALAQLERLKNSTDRIGSEAREAIRWLDDITSTPPPQESGRVELQGVDECYTTWDEVAQYLLPETLLSMESSDMSSLVDSMDKSLSVKDDEEAISSTDSLDAYSESPASRRSTNSSTVPDFSPNSPEKWTAEHPTQDASPEASGSASQSSAVPHSLQPLFNHILWRVHADPRAGLSMPDSYVLLTNDRAKQIVAQKFGIRAKRLEQLRDIVTREERDYRNRLLVLKKEAALSESQLAARREKRLSGNTGSSSKQNKDIRHKADAESEEPQKDDDAEEDVVVFRPRQMKPITQPQKSASPQPAQGPKVFDPNTFARAATTGMNTAPSTRSNNGQSSRNGASSSRGPRGGFGQGRGNRNSGGSSPGKTPARPVAVDLTQPIDPDSFSRPSPAGRGGRGGRRRLWEAT